MSLKSLHSLFLKDTPLLDVRSPSEFAQGAFPNATNIPLLNDEERHDVGICYAQKGHEAAVALGEKLISGDRKSKLLQNWITWCHNNPSGVLYCWRGGERSKISQAWLAEQGVEIQRVEGGFKALRHFLWEEMERIIAENNFLVIAGPTGSGKTELIQQLPNAIDLEAYANHRGSAFGGNTTPQPSQIDFEHRLAIQLLKLAEKGFRTIVVEDESRMIGKSALPVSLTKIILSSPIALLEEPIEKRVRRIITHYIPEKEKLIPNLNKIARRLGGALHKELLSDLEMALKESDPLAHRSWITSILTNYYDPLYEHSVRQRKHLVTMTGSDSQLRHKLTTHSL